MPAKPQVLVVDDGESYAALVAERMPEVDLVRPGGAASLRLEDGPSALSFLERSRPEVDVVLLDMSFDIPPERLLEVAPGLSPRRTRRFQGVAILRAIRRRFPDLPVVLLTSEEHLSLVDADSDLAAESMTYLLDGEDLDALRIRIHAAVAEAALGLEDAGVLWGRHPSMRAVRRRLAVLSKGTMPVIIEGETGTGKSYLAEEFVHRNSGRSGAFVPVDLSSLPPDLVPAHLFGAARGAYTGAVAERKGVFETANRGTIFLDEVQNAPLDVQKQLLLVLQDRRVSPLGSSKQVPVDVKVIAASNTPLADSVAAGRFRADLYMRLGPPMRVRIPPLRERMSDLSAFVRHFVARAARNDPVRALIEELGAAVGAGGLRTGEGTELQLVVGRPCGRGVASGWVVLVVPTPAWELLRSHNWPGNVRELMMVVQNMVTFTLVGALDALRAGLSLESPRLQVDPGLVGELVGGQPAVPEPAEDPAAAPPESAYRVRVSPRHALSAVSSDLERQVYEYMFARTGGDLSRMAELLLGDPGRSRAVRLRLNQLGLKVRELRRR